MQAHVHLAQFLDKLTINFLVIDNKINAKKALYVQASYLRSQRKKSISYNKQQ